MTVFTKDIFETLIFQERTKKNLHTANISERVQLVQALRCNIKQFNIHEVIRFNEQARRTGGIYNLTILDTLTFTEQQHPKVKVYDVADVLALVEFTSHLAQIDRIIVTEVLTYFLIKTISEVLEITEILSFKANRKLPIIETLTIREGLIGILVDEGGMYSDISQPCPDNSSPFTFGIAVQEVPIGTINGSNTIFTLTVAPAQEESLLVYVNGLLQNNSFTGDYTFTGITITFNAGSIPQSGDTLLAYYIR